jgi:hypothetical protein
LISGEARKLESLIDEACLVNPLLKQGRAQATWQYLAFCEDMLLKELWNEDKSPQRMSMFTDYLVNNMQYPIRWIWSHCKKVGYVAQNWSDSNYEAAWKLMELADEYSPFETVFIYGSAGYLDLEVNGNEIVPSKSVNDLRYEAYDRLLSCDKGPQERADPTELFLAVASTVKVKHDRFAYTLNPGIVAFAKQVMRPVDKESLVLPANWQLPDFSFGDFQSVVSTTRAIAMIHNFARREAARRGCGAMGIRDSVFVTTQHDFVQRLKNYTRLDSAKIEKIIGTLTYGNSGVRNPDPALQPFIPLYGDKIAISPSLWTGIDAERNFCVLCNRIEELKSHYSRLSEDRSSLMKTELERRLGASGLRFWSGSIPGRADLPDIDLAIIDDNAGVCLILELKSFIKPAEPREIIDRSKEIAKGVSQSRKLREFHDQQPSVLPALMSGRLEIRMHFGVVSQNSIGSEVVQDNSVFVVQLSHLVKRILAEGLNSSVHWLKERDYLPKAGEHFELVEADHTVAGVRLRWYAIRPLVADVYN